MAQTKAHSKASNKYNAKAYDRIAVQVYKGQREQIQAYAESKGMSVNGLINKLLANEMGAALSAPKSEE